jgi:hypothetical protein
MRNIAIKLLLLISFTGSFAVSCDSNRKEIHGQGLKIFSGNPYYWEFKGNPVLLLGGSDQDNLFNHPNLAPAGLEAHLDLLVKSGGNYVRNTMSHRDDGNIFAFIQVNGKYDLSLWNEEYWVLFDNFLKITSDRDIIVQLEIWETWDHYLDHADQGGWSTHPFNPLNNINYSLEESGLPEKIDFLAESTATTHNFFHSVPALENNKVVLPWQQALVDKILSYSFNYVHILYCMNNETGEPPEWGEYWAKYIREKAVEKQVPIHITDMRRSEILSSKDHRIIQDQPQLYTFLEISQNNGSSRRGQSHYDAIIDLRNYISGNPRPMNNVKVYGAEGRMGGVEEGINRFWRNIFAGSASIRFHRRFPPTGLGLNELAQVHLRSAREFTDALNIFECEPRNDLLLDRSPDGAYCLASPGVRYAVFFTEGGKVSLDVSATDNGLQINWYDIENSRWLGPEIVVHKNPLILSTPGQGRWAVLITRIDQSAI